MSHKELSKALDGFVSVLTEQELEPIRLDLIRIENDLKEEFDENFNVLKEAIENLASKVSDAFAEGLSEIEAEFIQRHEDLSVRISRLETKANIA
ncbi:MAG: hypothetical protein FWE23_08175 [Chitinivibrionia bacterium]|nr:hypothetical protein [Chitinivibrionia bacterium]